VKFCQLESDEKALNATFSNKTKVLVEPKIEKSVFSFEPIPSVEMDGCRYIYVFTDSVSRSSQR
jgi:hypothetical protein